MAALAQKLREIRQVLLKPLSLPGWVVLLVGIYTSVPDNLSRIEYWISVYRNDSWALRLLEPVVASPLFGVGIIILGLVYIFVTRGEVHHHSVSVQLARAEARGVAGTLDAANTTLALRTEAALRDRSLKDAIAFATTGKWGERLWEMGDGAISTTGKELEKFHQLARDGKLHVWGKLSPWGVQNPIPSDYWSNHRVDFLSLFRAEADIERDGTPPPHYRDLMVSRADFEREWPKP